ncbi:MAG: response regulator [Vicingaceae bacterium]
MAIELAKSKSRKAFIIDDEEGICTLLSALLKRIGLETAYSLKLEGAVESARSFNPNIIFLDLNLKDGSGFSIIPDLKKHLPKAKLVVISAHTENAEKQRALEMGATLFLEKPLSRSLIKETIEQLKF